MLLVRIRMILVCIHYVTCMSLVCICMYSYVIGMLRMYSYVSVCYSYVSRSTKCGALVILKINLVP